MKKKLKRFFLLIVSIAFILVLALLIKNRYTFGVWNPLSLPNRVECYDRRYYIAPSSPNSLSGNRKPGYLIPSSNNHTRKDLFTLEPKGELVPMVIYLKISDDRYQQYILSGGS